MKSIILLIFAVVLVCGGPIDDGLLDPNSRRRSPDEVNPDAVVVDVGGEPPRRTFRRPFVRPFFDQDDFQNEDEDDGGFGSFVGVVRRPFGWGQGFRPYGPTAYNGDFFTELRHQMDMFRQYIYSLRNITSQFGPDSIIPNNYDNSTYTTKVVNGSVISINETIKKHTTNDSSFVFKIKVVQVRPENETVVDDSGNEEKPSFGSWPLPDQNPEQETESSSSPTVQVESSSSPTVQIESSTATINPDDEWSNDVNGRGLVFR